MSKGQQRAFTRKGLTKVKEAEKPAPSIEKAQKAVTDALKAFDEVNANYQIGEMVPGKGVYFGVWTPPPSLEIKKIIRLAMSAKQKTVQYRLFAAPADLTAPNGHRLLLNYKAAAQEVAKIVDLCGHNGAYFESDRDIYEALRKDSYGGEWFIPPKPFLDGWDDDPRDAFIIRDEERKKSKKVFDYSLYEHRYVGAFIGTFKKQMANVAFGHEGYSYWSSSRKKRYRVGADFRHRDPAWADEDTRMLIRVVRVEPIPQ